MGMLRACPLEPDLAAPCSQAVPETLLYILRSPSWFPGGLRSRRAGDSRRRGRHGYCYTCTTRTRSVHIHGSRWGPSWTVGHSGHWVPEWTVGHSGVRSMHSTWTAKQGSFMAANSSPYSASCSTAELRSIPPQAEHGSQDLVPMRQVQGQPGLGTMFEEIF